MKIITIAGTIGRDAEVRRTQNGDAIAGWSVAVNSREGGQEQTTWFDCSLFGKRGEALAPYLRKGGKVTVCGEFSTREHGGKTYLQVRVSDVTLQGDSNRREEQAGPREDRTSDRRAPVGRQGADDDFDEIPF
jgi:single-strand DNA-binding protein